MSRVVAVTAKSVGAGQIPLEADGAAAASSNSSSSQHILSPNEEDEDDDSVAIPAAVAKDGEAAAHSANAVSVAAAAAAVATAATAKGEEGALDGAAQQDVDGSNNNSYNRLSSKHVTPDEPRDDDDHLNNNQREDDPQKPRAVEGQYNAVQHDHHHHHNSSDPAHAHEHEHDPGDISFYAPPRQRQRWGDPQVAPHTNWGDIFFDLFYVAAAYNLGNVLREDPTATGLLYTAGLFLPIVNLWAFKTFYDARFYYADDYWHRLYEIALLLALATAVLHIRPVQILSNPAAHPDMFVFCLGLCAAFYLALGRLLEIMLCQRLFQTAGLHPEAFVATRRDALGNMLAGAFFTAAAVYSGLQYFGEAHSAAEYGFLDGAAAAAEEGSNATTTEYNSSSTAAASENEGYNDHHMRFLAATATSEPSPYSTITKATEPDNIAIWLLLGGTFASVARFLQIVACFSLRKEDHKLSTVPMNVDFAIHRYGEWIMLMLGESILSLLIVDIVDTSGYYSTFVGGIISIVLLHYLHYQSAPSDPDQHAMRRSLPSSFAFYWLFQAYSLSLIILGASYKMLLFEFVYDEEDNYGSSSSHRQRRSMLLFPGPDQRWLAGGGASAALRFSAEDRQERIAHFFSGSLAMIFFLLDAMSLAHRGISTQWNRCESAETKTKKFLAFSLVVCKTVLLLFIATLSQYETDPKKLATIGLFTILAQLCVRVVGYYALCADEDEAEERAIERVINYNTARIHDRPDHPDSFRK